MHNGTVRVGVNGYGVIGKRVADAVALQGRHARFVDLGFEGAEEPVEPTPATGRAVARHHREEV